jgi:hypothetical protein
LAAKSKSALLVFSVFLYDHRYGADVELQLGGKLTVPKRSVCGNATGR